MRSNAIAAVENGLYYPRDFSYDRRMKQVIVVHGGTTFATYDTYLEYLRTKSIKLERLIYASTWKDTLQSDLGDNYQVLLPTMPNKTNAKYSEWKLWFDRIIEVVDDNCILIGHSLGAVFLVKYLSETACPKIISGTVLIAAPFKDESTEDLTDFKLNSISDMFIRQAGRVIFFNGDDDPIIPLSERDTYKANLPDAEFHTLSAPDHFVRPCFPELTTILRSL